MIANVVARLVHEGHRAARWRRTPRRAHLNAQLAQAAQRALSELVIAERRDQQRSARQARELHGRDGPSPGGLFEGLARVDHLAGARHVRDARELHPLDVANRRYSQSLHS